VQGFLSLNKEIHLILKDTGVMDTHGAYIKNAITDQDQEDLAQYLYRLMLVDFVTDSSTPTPRLTFKEKLKRSLKTTLGPTTEKFPNIQTFLQLLLELYNTRNDTTEIAKGYGMMGGIIPPPTIDKSDENHIKGLSLHKGKGNRNNQTLLNNLTSDDRCHGCGWTNICLDHARCHYKSHPGYNPDKNKTWDQSVNGQAYKVAKCANKQGQTDGRTKLSFLHHPNGTPLTKTEVETLQKGGMTKPKKLDNKRKQTGESNIDPSQILATYVSEKNK